MTREEKLQKAHQMFDNRNLLTELNWQREYFRRGYISSKEELFNLWIFDECIKALEQEPSKGEKPNGTDKEIHGVREELKAIEKELHNLNRILEKRKI